MKHLLILLISILLLSSFVTSCDKKEETLYRWETSSGIVWKRFGDKDTHRVYKGEWKNEKLNGLGVMTYPDGHKYVGEWKNGKVHGQGEFTWSNGDKYEGEWKKGEKHGQGTVTFSGGGKWIGEFRRVKPWNITGYDKDGNIIGKFVNGVEQKVTSLKTNPIISCE